MQRLAWLHPLSGRAGCRRSAPESERPDGGEALHWRSFSATPANCAISPAAPRPLQWSPATTPRSRKSWPIYGRRVSDLSPMVLQLTVEKLLELCRAESNVSQNASQSSNLQIPISVKRHGRAVDFRVRENDESH